MHNIEDISDFLINILSAPRSVVIHTVARIVVFVFDSLDSCVHGGGGVCCILT